jgi:hypothetical protein
MTLEEGGPAFPTLRCPSCGHADLLFKPAGEVRCGKCFKRWTREQLVRTPGSAGRSFDREVKDTKEG